MGRLMQQRRNRFSRYRDGDLSTGRPAMVVAILQPVGPGGLMTVHEARDDEPGTRGFPQSNAAAATTSNAKDCTSRQTTQV
jgi:hypothetical protein